LRRHLSRPRRDLGLLVLLLLALLEAGLSEAVPQLRASAERDLEGKMTNPSALLIDDFSGADGLSALRTQWRVFTDQVMGGVSTGASGVETVGGRRALRLVGEVSLENNGGFVQVALPLSLDGGPLDAQAYTGVRLSVRGNGETYHIHIRTTATSLPWQYYEAGFSAGPAWTSVELPFARFTAEALGARLDPSKLTRIAVVASKKHFRADVAVSKIEFYK
jgi:hypothetical protein